MCLCQSDPYLKTCLKFYLQNLPNPAHPEDHSLSRAAIVHLFAIHTIHLEPIIPCLVFSLMLS